MGAVKQTIAPASNLILAGFSYYLACERIIAIMPVIVYGDYDPVIHGQARWKATFTKRYLAQQKASGARILDFTRGRKVHSVILMDDGTLVKSPFNPTTLVERIETKRNTGNLVVRSDKGKPRPKAAADAALRARKKEEALPTP
jgi:regulator of extracellular matrix RemA (YlzA/DUF370 family)